tara:strand:- start:1531 stop:3153 length:1623 start_codon:yes stop_codon:yes gene_type:complete
MALLDLLTSNTFNNGISQDSFGNSLVDENGNNLVYPNYNLSYGGPSKSFNFNNRDGKEQPIFHLLDRVSWTEDNDNLLTNPDLRGGDHRGNSQNDFILRGGVASYFERRALDVRRITNFLYASPQGGQFLLRQGALQLLNPQTNTRTFNAGVSLLASIAAAGVTSFKRTGLIPEPVDFNYNADEGSARSSGFLTNLFGGGYLDIIGGENTIENKYGIGSPGSLKSTPDTGNLISSVVGGSSNYFKNARNYNSNVEKIESKNDYKPYVQTGIDLINYQDIVKAKGGTLNQFIANKEGETLHYKDTVPFRIESVDPVDPSDSNYIIFRAFLKSINDDYNASHNQIKYNGRGEMFYTYNNFTRKIQIGFVIAAQTRHEMKPLYRKLNYLAAQTAPHYSGIGRIMTPYAKLTVGDLFYRIPGIINNVNISWNTNYTWEIRADEKKDADMLVLPHVLDVGFGFTPVHAFVPENSYKSPFLGIGGKHSGVTHRFSDVNWIDKNIDTAAKAIDSESTEVSGERQETSTTDDEIALNTQDTNNYSSIG